MGGGPAGRNGHLRPWPIALDERAVTARPHPRTRGARGESCRPSRAASRDGARARRAAGRTDRAPKARPMPLRTMQWTAGCRGASERHRRGPRASHPCGVECAWPRPEAAPRANSRARCRAGPPSGRAAGCADDHGRTRAARGYRAESPRPSSARKPETLRRPDPGPLSALDHGVQPLDHRGPARCGGLRFGLLGAHREADAAPLDDDGLTALRCVQHVGEMLTGLCGGVSLHGCTVYITMGVMLDGRGLPPQHKTSLSPKAEPARSTRAPTGARRMPLGLHAKSIVSGGARWRGSSPRSPASRPPG